MNIKNIAFLISCLSLNSTYNNNDVLCLNVNKMNAKTITQITSKPIVRKDKLLPKLDTTTFDTRKEYKIKDFDKEAKEINYHKSEYHKLDNLWYKFDNNSCTVFDGLAHCIYGNAILDDIKVETKKVCQYKNLGLIGTANLEIPDKVYTIFRLKNSINIPIATLQCASISKNNDDMSVTLTASSGITYDYSEMEETSITYGSSITATYGGNIGAEVGIDDFIKVSGEKSASVGTTLSQDFSKTLAISKTYSFMVNSGISYTFNPNNTYDQTQYYSLNARAKFTPFIIAKFECVYDVSENGKCFMGRNYGYVMTGIKHIETKATFIPTSTLFTRIDKYLDSESGNYWEYLNPDNSNGNIIFM